MSIHRLSWIVSIFLFFITGIAGAKEYRYRLNIQKIAEGVYVSLGKKEHFTKENGGNIMNVVMFDAGKDVILTGGGVSKLQGEALKKEVQKIFGKPVGVFIVNNRLPDKYLSLSAFDPSIAWATAETTKQIRQHGDAVLDVLYRLLGDWMKGTQNIIPKNEMKAGTFTHGNREFEVRIMAGYTSSDLILYEKKSGVLIAGGLVFYNRAATFPYADITAWKKSLEILSKQKFTVLVPDHGDLDREGKSITQTLNYMNWLDKTFREKAQEGEDANFMMKAYKGTPFENLAVIEEEFPRTIQHQYFKYERSVF